MERERSGRRAWTVGVPLVVLALCIVLALVAKPPPELTTTLGDESWAKVVVAFVLFLGLYAIAVILGVAVGRVALFGASVERGVDAIANPEALIAELKALREADERAHARTGEVRQLAHDALLQLAHLENRVAELERSRTSPPTSGEFPDG